MIIQQIVIQILIIFSPKLSFSYPINAIIDWNCNNNDCNDNEYMEIITINDNNNGYSSNLYLINKCMSFINGQGIL